ncbi:hypothetical protein PL321_06530 [Caloramator sp. mosi_1]|nr:hypothetical protein [Caloramator sp. mosi_1]WDC85141.1 hypothetical protein PL321_06530 [Caloramator sp. mosi_1]
MLALLLSILMTATVLAGCGKKKTMQKKLIATLMCQQILRMEAGC